MKKNHIKHLMQILIYFEGCNACKHFFYFPTFQFSRIFSIRSSLSRFFVSLIKNNNKIGKSIYRPCVLRNGATCRQKSRGNKVSSRKNIQRHYGPLVHRTNAIDLPLINCGAKYTNLWPLNVLMFSQNGHLFPQIGHK